jgi:hypothetical protein
MAYQIQKTGNFYVVKKDGKIHMKVYPTVNGQPPRRVGHTAKGPDVEYTMDIAAQAVRYVRRQLPRGAFNNQMEIQGQYKYLTKNVAPKWLAARAETMYASLAYRGEKPRDTATQMAARSLATISVGGGVCSLMTYVTAGYLTTIAKRGTKIVTVFDNSFDHEYVVLYYGTSPYVVADPWVGTSYVCFWHECYFPPKDVSVNTRMEIGESLSVPYGVEFTDQEVRTAERIGEINLIDNPPKNQILALAKQGLDQKKKFPWFHMDGAYGHPDNIKPVLKMKYKPIVGPDEWGEAVK